MDYSLGGQSYLHCKAKILEGNRHAGSGLITLNVTFVQPLLPFSH